MFGALVDAVKAAKEQQRSQLRLNALIGQKKKSDYVKLRLPKKYIPMIEVLARYGVEDSKRLAEILEMGASMRRVIEQYNAEIK